MKHLVATVFFSLFCIPFSLTGLAVEWNSSYDYFRGMADGSWSGNNGALIAVNSGLNLLDYANLQAGASYGLYDWDGRGNVVFANPKVVEQIAFLTVGASSTLWNWNAGLVYDRLYTYHFGIYDLSPTLDQLRFQLGYSLHSDEVGFWGTASLTTSHGYALGIPTNFKAIGQMNLFWSHFFQNCAKTTLWIGLPYQDSLMFPKGRAGKFMIGASFQVPLTDTLFIDGNGSYMAARSSLGSIQSRNYASSLRIGLTYCFSSHSRSCDTPYMGIANHSNFLVDTNVNQ